MTIVIEREREFERHMNAVRTHTHTGIFCFCNTMGSLQAKTSYLRNTVLTELMLFEVLILKDFARLTGLLVISSKVILDAERESALCSLSEIDNCSRASPTDLPRNEEVLVACELRRS